MLLETSAVFLADLFRDQHVEIIEHSETRYGIGLFPDLSEAGSKWIRPSDVIQPVPTWGNYYRLRLARYQRLLSHLSCWAEDQAPFCETPAAGMPRQDSSHAERTVS